MATSFSVGRKSERTTDNNNNKIIKERSIFPDIKVCKLFIHNNNNNNNHKRITWRLVLVLGGSQREPQTIIIIRL